jgi:hypothetical protein
MKMRTAKLLLQGLGAAILLMISHLAALVSPYHAVLYHSILPMRSVVWGTLIDLVVASLLAALLFGYLQKRQTGLLTLVWVFIAARIAHTTVGIVSSTLGWNIPHLTPSTATILTLVVGLTLWAVRPPAYRAAVHGLLALLILAGCNAVWMVPQLVYLGLQPQRGDAVELTAHPVLASGQTAPKNDGRIIWLLFDELSYDQTFEHRFPGLSMPSFDEFRNRSVVFSDLKPVGMNTDLVIPGLFLGKPVAKIRSDLNGMPALRLAGTQQWQPFDAHATLFGEAQRQGWTTGVAGWFNPYCRILAGTLDSCFWRMGGGELDGPLSTKSSLQNAMSPIQNILGWVEGKPSFLRQVQQADLAAIVPAATALIRDQNIRFVFIHLPVPHPPGIYDRRTGTVRGAGTYIDNLALSDRVMGELMRTINATPQAGKTTVIVCSDHSWRLGIWQGLGLWSKEEEIATGGRFDPRPVLMIHLPGQPAGHVVSEPFDEIRIHEIIERMLRGQDPGLDKALLAGAGLPAAAKP